MKSFIIQSLALIGAVVVIVDMASIHRQHQQVMLESILADANNMLNKCSQKNLTSPVARPWDGKIKCWKHFFCLAEKSLNSLNLTSFAQSKLTKQLQEYNKLTKITNCHLNESNTISLRELLETIPECTTDRF